jgi:hypothetical protein
VILKQNITGVYRSIHELKEGSRTRTNVVKNETGNLLEHSHSILNRLNYSCQVLNAHGFSYIKQTKVHTAEPLVPEPGSLDVDITIEKLKRINHQILNKFRQNCSNQEVIYHVLKSTDLLILFGIRKNCHSSGRNLLLFLYIKRGMKLTVVMIQEYRYYQLHTTVCPIFLSCR